MDVGSGRISVIQVAREPDVARETPAPAAVPPSPGRSARPTHPVSRPLSPADPPGRPPPSPGRPARPPPPVPRTPGPAAVPGLPTAPIWAARGAPPAAAMGRFVAAYRWCFAFVAVL